MPVAKAKVEDPCLGCRDRHSKCDDTRPRCKQCERAGEECVRVSSKLKFKHGSSGKYDTKFKKEQPWMMQTKNARIQFIDQTPELENYYALDLESDKEDGPLQQQDTVQSGSGRPSVLQRSATTHNSPSDDQSLPRSESPDALLSLRDAVTPHSGHKRQRTNEYEDINASYRLPSLPSTPLQFQSFQNTAPHSDISIDAILNSPQESGHFETAAVEAEYRRLADSAAAAIPSASSGLLAPDVWKKKFVWPNRFTTTQCACLMRYFVEELAPWLDVCDPAHHYTTIVPQRARRCPPLLNAIFTLAARHLFHISKYKTTDGIVRYQGINLRDLTASTAIRYHNASLAYLIELSADPRQVTDEDLFAAAVILRYYEELDSDITGEDPETFLQTFQIFTNAQLNADVTSPAINTPTSLPSTYAHSFPHQSLLLSAANDVKSFRHASLRIATRQEITSAFIKQRPIRLPLQAWSSLHSFSEAEDAVWTDRLIAFCANVVQFCFGEDNTAQIALLANQTRLGRWQELKEFERLWDLHRPLSFNAIHYQEPNARPDDVDSVFPQIWHLSGLHVAGHQYLDLARILLTVYDPAIPRLGPGAAAAMKRIGEEVRQLVLRICGIAVSNAMSSQPGLVMASLAIAVCGEYFVDDQQRRAMIRLLERLEREFAWPVKRTVKELREAWGWK